VAKKNVVEITCDRCDRTEYLDPDDVADVPDLELSFGGKEPVVAVFGELCSSCRKTVKNLSEQIAKKISWKRSKGGEEPEAKEEGGAPVAPPPSP
jgi:hypothetical protein